MAPGLLNLQVLDTGAGAYEETKAEDQPPQPRVLRAHQLRRALHNQGPLHEGQAEAGQRAIPESFRL